MKDPYTEKELFTWMMSKPDDKRVDMSDGTIGYGCVGCVMAEFLKTKGLKSGHVDATGHRGKSKNNNKLINLDKGDIFRYFNFSGREKTFGGLKKAFKFPELLK